MTGCEILKCKWFINNKCTEPFDYVNKNTGQSMCSRNENAIPREEYSLQDEE